MPSLEAGALSVAGDKEDLSVKEQEEESERERARTKLHVNHITCFSILIYRKPRVANKMEAVL